MSGVRKSANSAWSQNQSVIQRNESEIVNDESSSASDYTRQPRSASQLKNQTFGQYNSEGPTPQTNPDMLSPGMQEEGIANIAISNNAL